VTWRPGEPIMIDLSAARDHSPVPFPVILVGAPCAVLVAALIMLLIDAQPVDVHEYLEFPLVGGAGVLAFILMLGVGKLWTRWRTRIPSRVFLEPAGIRLEDRRGTSSAVGWGELSAVSIVAWFEPGTVSSPRPIVTWRRPTILVRINLVPADVGFHDRHSELARYRTPGSLQMSHYRVPLGAARAMIDQLAHGFQLYAQGRFRGVFEEDALSLTRHR
jgi:hypothetical protein